MTETFCCPSCGVAIPTGASFCAFCGITIQPEAELSVTHEGRPGLAMTRYREGYLEARSINGIGAAIKTVALIVGGLMTFGGLIAFSESNGFGEIAGIASLLTGLGFGFVGFILGILVQAAGQSMKAHCDCAVNGSHFLNDDQRAEVMSLK